MIAQRFLPVKFLITNFNFKAAKKNPAEFDGKIFIVSYELRLHHAAHAAHTGRCRRRIGFGLVGNERFGRKNHRRD